MKYRKKPVEVEAFQMTRRRRNDNSEWPNWMHEAWNKDKAEPGAIFIDAGNAAVYENGSGLGVVTLAGPVHIDYGDFIVQGVEGELYPCTPDIFEATHEAVEEGASTQPR